MNRTLAAALLLAGTLPLVAVAQETEIARGTGAVLRGLDKVNASVTDLDLAAGASTTFGRLTVRLEECRYPAANPAGEAYAFLVISDTASGKELFSGWMLASSPALNALEHPRYDIWVLRCKTD